MSSPTPAELADLAAKLATTTNTLAAAEKTRADADKVRADADQVRAGTEKERQLAQNAVDVAAADLEAKRIANDKARSDADSARIDKLISQLSGAVPELSKLQKNTVSFSEGKVLRQAEANALALTGVAATIAREVVDALADKPKTTLFVTSEPRLVAAIAAYRQLMDEAGLLKTRLTEARQAAETVLQPGDARPITKFADAGTGAALVVAAVAGKAITEVASLFEIDVAVASSTAELPAAAVHASVMRELLRLAKERRLTLVIQHEWARIPDPESPLRQAVKTLTSEDRAAAATILQLQAQLDALGDPEGDLAKALKAAEAATSDDERGVAQEKAKEAVERVTRLNTLTTAKSALQAAAAKAKAFADRVSAVSPETGSSPLTTAYSIEPLATKSQHRRVLLLGGATAEANQVVVTRRLLAPRVHVSTSVEAHYLLLDDDGVVAAGRSSASAAYAARITRWGAGWSRIQGLTGPSAP